MKIFFRTLIPFLAGMVVAINLNKLIETNPNYYASWTTVVFAVVAVLVAAIAWN